MARLEPIMWIDLDTREITEVPRDSHGKFMTPDRVGGPPPAERPIRLDPVYGNHRCVECGVWVNERWWHRIFAGHAYKAAA